MSLARFQFPFLASAVCALVVITAPAGADDKSSVQQNNPATHVWMAEQPDQPQKPDKHPTRHKVVRFAKAIGNELKTEAVDSTKDAIMLFSVQDYDPYDVKAPKDKPYKMFDFLLVDGTEASLTAYPDGSARVVGGFADGTVLIPESTGKYLVKYPNGVRGQMEKVNNNTYKIYRPDNTVTTCSREPDGRWRMNNSQVGYMGEAIPDETGLRYEFQ